MKKPGKLSFSYPKYHGKQPQKNSAFKGIGVTPNKRVSPGGYHQALLANYIFTFLYMKGDLCMTNIYTSVDQLPINLCAEQVAQVLGISRAGAYTLMHSKGFPTIRIGKRMVVPKDKLLAWMEEQTAV